jgi:phage N-6-adenine-methyltransferase
MQSNDRTGNAQTWGAKFSSERPDWRTPRWLFDKLAAHYQFSIDLAASADNALLPRFYTEQDSAFLHSWQGETAFLNPPYGRELAGWCERAEYAARRQGAVIVALLPVRTGVKWWHEYIAHKATVMFLKGRLKFDGVAFNAPFDSAIVVWRDAPPYTFYWDAKRTRFPV